MMQSMTKEKPKRLKRRKKNKEQTSINSSPKTKSKATKMDIPNQSDILFFSFIFFSKI